MQEGWQRYRAWRCTSAAARRALGLLRAAAAGAAPSAHRVTAPLPPSQAQQQCSHITCRQAVWRKEAMRRWPLKRCAGFRCEAACT